MDPNAAPAPSLISSLEAMIQASVNSVLDCRFGYADEHLDTKIQNAVATAVDRRVGLAVGSMGNRLTSMIEHRLGNAVSTLDFRVNKSVTAAIEQRLGPAGSALTAQVTFTAAPPQVLASPKVQELGLVNGTKESNEIRQMENGLGETQRIGNGGSTREAHPPQDQDQNSGGQEKEQPAQKLSPAKPRSQTVPIEKEKPAQELKATGREASNTTLAESGHEPRAEKNPAKRKTNQLDEGSKIDEAGEPDSSSEEEKGDNRKRKRKRTKVKLDPPGYTNGPAIKFRRVSPKLTACAKSRGYPRVIDLKSFAETSNKQNLTMADVVATVLFNYDPLSLHAFMDMDSFPTFHFARKESNRKAKNFVIERRRESYGVVVQVSSL